MTTTKTTNTYPDFSIIKALNSQLPDAATEIERQLQEMIVVRKFTIVSTLHKKCDDSRPSLAGIFNPQTSPDYHQSSWVLSGDDVRDILARYMTRHNIDVTSLGLSEEVLATLTPDNKEIPSQAAAVFCLSVD
ncbi:MAG: hypothetical protein KDJ26_02785 [Alphaproteobacteria bacterium]|nr:hypothetical protein [Alphaproteobacteria bacterium]MCB9985793.1 hypothetical protein [Micavibrio sp.]HPQ51277.1 hypothetical protein [Alphaproteobacteria bacterium]